MTTIVYKDGILAADTRSSHKTTPETFCLKLKTVGVSGNDNRCKIHLYEKEYPDALFRGEKILASAASGMISWVNAMHAMLKLNVNVEVCNAHISNVIEAGVKREMPASLIVITEKSGYRLRYGGVVKGETTKFALDTDRIIAIGSGAKYAYSAMMVGQLGAVEAVGAAGVCDPSTSLKVDWVDCLKKNGSPYLKKARVDFSTNRKPVYML